MIPPEQQVTTLETSRRLEELKVPQESLFYWNEKTKRLTTKDKRFEYINYTDEGSSDVTIKRYYKNISAFTVAELIALFPDDLELFVKALEGLGIGDNDRKYKMMYDPDIVAKMLIYLLQNKIICIEDLI